MHANRAACERALLPNCGKKRNAVRRIDRVGSSTGWCRQAVNDGTANGEQAAFSYCCESESSLSYPGRVLTHS
jgi:hypothetical protein